MPYYHHQRGFTPLSVIADKKARKNGLRHAIFTSRFDSYVGEWKSDLKEGKGRYTTIGGMLYEGDWYQGYRHGFGLLSKHQPNGTYRLVYRGDWVRGKMEGPGWMYFENGDVYLGLFKGGKKCGFGNMWYADNKFYSGYWKNDLRDGLGLFLVASDEIAKVTSGTQQAVDAAESRGHRQKPQILHRPNVISILQDH